MYWFWVEIMGLMESFTQMFGKVEIINGVGKELEEIWGGSLPLMALGFRVKGGRIRIDF